VGSVRRFCPGTDHARAAADALVRRGPDPVGVSRELAWPGPARPARVDPSVCRAERGAATVRDYTGRGEVNSRRRIPCVVSSSSTK
jgi:hypothetical protein